MSWFSEFQLFLFDLDGLLVNTEELHYQAYKNMLKKRGYHLPWDFAKYFSIAQLDAQAPRRYIYAEFEKLYREEPNWDVLYAEKKQAYIDLLHQNQAPLMPGAKEVLELLQEKGINRCVVTHSAKNQVEALCEQNPLLKTIPHWITREDYKMPKPAPDGYLKAISLYANTTDRVIGFEDSMRGLVSLMATPATPILINPIDERLRSTYKERGVKVFTSFSELLKRPEL